MKRIILISEPKRRKARFWLGYAYGFIAGLIVAGITNYILELIK